MSRGWVITLLVGVTLVVGDVAVSAIWPQPSRLDIDAAIWHAAVGGVWIAAGLVAWARRPALRIGLLMSAAGFAWLLTQHQWWPTALATHVHYVLGGIALPIGVHALLAYPTGRLDGRAARVVVAAAYIDTVVGNVLRLLFLDSRDGRCPECPRNLLLVDRRPGLAEAIDVTTSAIGVAIGVALAALLVRRWRLASPAGRDALGPVIWSAVIAAAVAVVHLGVQDFGAMPAWLSRVVLYGFWLSVALVPVAFLVGLLRARMRRAAMTELMVELGRLPPVEHVRDALARALGDPSLRLVFWDPESGGYIDPDGAATTLSAVGPARAVTVLEHGGQRYGALVHDPFILEDSTMLEAVGAAGRLAIENARLQAELRAQLAEVRASRARIVEAGDAERRRIERDLHDGAQQRLLAIRLALRLARSRAPDEDAEMQTLLAEADEELVAGLDELRALASGIHPAVLTDEGLSAALSALARRATVPVELLAVPAARFPPALEAGVYFVACEALANAAKHAQASHVTIAVIQSGGRLHLEISDDGIGGADEAGSGLRGLADRVAALHGELHITSDIGVGTTLRAALPCADSATTSLSS